MAVVTDQSKLVLNAFAATFQNNLISADLVTWNQYSGEMNDRDRFQVSEQVGPRYAVTQTSNGVADLTSGVQDTVFGSEQFTVNRTFGTSMGWGDFVKIRDIGDARESEALKNAATRLAEVIDAYILGYAALASNNWVGTAGNNVATWNDVASAYTRLKEEGVDDSDLRGVLTYSDKQALGGSIVSTAALNEMAEGTYRQGFTGEIDGLPFMFTQQLPSLTAGTHAGTPLVNGAAQGVNYSAVSVSSAPGNYLTQTIAIDGLGANQTIKDGETFTLTGVNAYDNRLGASLGRLQQFRVVGDTTADGTGAIAALRIFPAIIVPGSGSGGDINVNTANATVTAAPADNAPITFQLTASTAYKPRFIMQKQAVIVNTKDLITPSTGVSARKTLTKVPVSVRMWTNSDFNTGNHNVRFDVALTANVRDRRRIVRVNGS